MFKLSLKERVEEAEATSSGMAFHFPTTSIGKKFLRWLVKTRGRKSDVEFLCCIPGLGCGVNSESGTRESRGADLF